MWKIKKRCGHKQKLPDRPVNKLWCRTICWMLHNSDTLKYMKMNIKPVVTECHKIT